MGRSSKVIIGALATAALVVVMVAPSEASDIQSFKTVFATDVVYAGLGGMRDGGSGSITVSGVSGTVTEAHLFWHGPTNVADPASNATVTFAGQSVTGTNIGSSSDNCWGYDNSQAYRADVTSLVAGNGSFAVADFVKSGGDVNVNGVGLAVFFDDGNDANNRDVVMFNGNDSNVSNSFDADGWNVTLPGINYASGTASMDMMVSDGQVYEDGSLQLNAATLDPGPSLFQGDTVPSAGANNNGFLWDQRAFDVTSALTPGPNTLSVTHAYMSDCLSLVMAAVNLPAGSAPNQPTTTTTSTTAPPQSSSTTQATTSTTSSSAAAVVATPRFTG